MGPVLYLACNVNISRADCDAICCSIRMNHIPPSPSDSRKYGAAPRRRARVALPARIAARSVAGGRATAAFLLVAASCFLLASCVRLRPVAPPEFSFISVKEGVTVTESGAPIVLKGCNLGNWFLLEMWMLDRSKDLRDQREFESVLTERFGREKKDSLMELYRANWITERDFPIVRSFGFNVVRLPFDYSLLMDDARPMELKPDAFKWLDAAVEMAARNGLYTILDLHGVPGRQSFDHTTGWAGQNKLWDNEEFKKQTVWLWKQIAEHYKDQPAIAAYDLINEPFGDGKSDDHGPALAALTDEIYKAVRLVDQRHIMILNGTTRGVGCYGNPSDHGWQNVMFAEHYYPGVLASSPSFEPHRNLVNREMPYNERVFKQMGVPLLIGEFNVVFRFLGGPVLMRQYYDLYASKGWWATMWSYKLVKRAGGAVEHPWYMVANAKEMPGVSLRTSSYEEIEALFKWFGTMEYTEYDALRSALTTNAPSHIYIEKEPFPMDAPFSDPLGAWQGTDIASRPAGGQKVISESDMDVYGGGRDLWNNHDEFRFVWQKVSGDLNFDAVVESLDEPFMYAKAGIMIRGGLEPDSPHVLVHVFPSSQVSVGWREAKGGTMKERKFPIREFPVHLQLIKRGDRVSAAWSIDGIHWVSGGTYTFDWLSGECYAGLAVLSHDDRYLARAAFRNIKISNVAPAEVAAGAEAVPADTPPEEREPTQEPAAPASDAVPAQAIP